MVIEVQALADYIGEPISEEAEVKQAKALLSFATSLVETHIGYVFDNAVPVLAQSIIVAVAARKFTNFDGFTSESVDDWRGHGRKVEEDGLYLTATEKKALDSLRKNAGGPFVSVSTYRADLDVGGVFWAPTDEAPHVSVPIPW